MKKNILFLSILVFLAFSCQEEIFPQDFVIGEEENFKWGNEYFSNDNTVKLTITEINDSRCPSDVVCVWQGEALVKIKVETSEINTIELSTFDNPKDTVDSFSIELVQVSPYPISTKSIDLEDYTVKLKIEEIAD